MVYLTTDDVGGSLRDLLDVYLNWNGIIGYTSDIMDYWEDIFDKDEEGIKEFLDEEGIYGYTTDILDLLNSGEVTISDMDEEDFMKLKRQLGIYESVRKPMRRRLKEDEIRRYSDVVPYEKRRYWYWTKHGLGPGTLPKGVNVLDAKEGQNQKGTWGVFVLLDAVLNTDELREYDLIELAPKEERKPLRANIWNADGTVTTGDIVEGTFNKRGKRLTDNFPGESFIKESRQLNEGPGAGYTISGKIGDVHINDFAVDVKEETETAIFYRVTGDIVLDLVDISCESYYYGGTIPEATAKVDYIDLYAEKSWELSTPTEDDVYNLLMSNVHFETVYGGGWSHSTFGNDLELDYNDIKNYYGDYDLDKIAFKFTDPKVVDAIDKYATGENYTVEFSVLDENDYEVEFFDSKEDAIEYAKENNLPYVSETHWGWEYLGDDEYDTTDEFDSSEIIWTNEDFGE